MGFQPTFHPDITALRLPDFDQFHNSLTVRTLKGVVAETGFETLAPGERVKGFSEWIEVKISSWR